jgi:arsenite methyltransferase
MLGKLAGVRNKVLDRANLSAGERFLDVGCGEGLIGFGALERGASHVVFSDVSDDLLAFCRETAAALDVSDRCSFVRASAADLDGIADASVDVVSTRSVLIYVADKKGAFGEFFRVLAAGGRVSVYEPINRFGSCERRGGF